MRLRRIVETSVVGLLVVALGGFALAHDGVPATEVDLNDGGVWVTNPAEGLVGHFNYQSRVLDGGLDPLTREFDLSQEGNSVLLQDASSQAATAIDTATVTLGTRTATTGLDYSHGKDTVLIASAAEGKVWATSLEGFAGFSASASPLLEGLEQPRVITGRDGIGFVVDASGQVTKITQTSQGFVTESAGTIDEGLTETTALTIAGTQLVAVDEGRVRTVDRSIEVAQIDATAQVQQASLETGRVSVAVSDALVTVPLAGGEISVTEVASGVAAAPVDVAGCIYGAWAGSGAYLRDCLTDADDIISSNDALATAEDVVFRVSRDIVAINDAAGNVYLPNEGMTVINDWEKIKSQVEDQNRQQDDQDDQLREETEVENPEQVPPVAENDELGARPGSTTTLPVLANDNDPDGDIMTVQLVDVPDNVQVSLGRDGRAAQIFMPAEATSPVSFSYQAFDGEELSNTATVTVNPYPDTDNAPPVRQRDNVLNLTQNATVEHSVLPDWADPEGDPIYLKEATGDEHTAVTFRQDGFISIRDLGTGEAGRREIPIVVSDGREETPAVLAIQVAPGSANLPPVANSDHFTVNIGEQVRLRPLSNDTDPNGGPLMLAGIATPSADQSLEVDYEQGTAMFSATRVGVHELEYQVSDGPNSDTGKIRIDVNDPASVSKTPSAQNDLALLPDNSSVLVPVLDNDSDPARGVLAVQSLSIDEGAGITVEVIDHSMLRVSAPSRLNAPVTFSYTISNGYESATAAVLVLPQPPRATNQPPVAADDTAVVRVGDIVAIPVLDNDYSPTELELSISPTIEVRGENLGEVFVSGNKVRFRAGSQAGAVTLVYSCVDEAGNHATAQISLTIRDLESGNQKPAPYPVTARVFAGATTQVAVPLDGIDPDGDTVELVDGASTGPKLGSVEVQGGYLIYTAQSELTGTDVFTYRVKDRFGMVGEASIQVGVVPPPAVNQLPVAVPDQVTVRPQHTVEIPVTHNDVDPDGDDISIIEGSPQSLDPWNTELEIVGQDVRATTPAEVGSYQFSYDITDGHGAPVTGYGTIMVDPQAPLQAPVATDDRVLAADIVGRSEVSLDVLKNDRDPDGSRQDLTIQVETPATVAEDGTVLIPLADDMQVLLYTITDADGQSSQAAIFVPGLNEIPPILDKTKIPATVKGGETLRIDLGEYVLTRRDRTAKVTAEDTVIPGAGRNTEADNGGVNVVSETVIEFTPDAGFYGPTSLTFEVHDGANLDDPTGLRSTLSLPIEVTTSGLFPPQLRPSPVEVAPGESPITASLRDMVDDPDEGDNDKMAYQLIAADEGFQVTVDGQQMQVSTPASTPPGTTGVITVQVHDGTTDPLPMEIPVTVVQSTRPLITTVELTDDNARVGQPSVFDLTTATTNPYADQGKPITIVGSEIRSGSATASIEGMNLSVTPNEIGTVVVSYVAQDATQDSSRQVTGQVVLTVKDTPLPPQNLTAKSDASRTAQLQWTQGDLRGGTLQHYLVQWSGGSQECPTTNCLITGLTNNLDYTFTVSAVTEVGTSEPSGSASARPDVKPNQPAVPTTTWGDQKIELSWPRTQVPDGGSPVTKYIVQVSPGINGQTEFETTGEQFTAAGLTNGTAYRFQIKAINRYAENNVARESEYLWSGYSAPTIPAGAPSGQGAPKVTKDPASSTLQPSATVSWQAPSNPNGDTSFTYELRETGSATVLYRGSATSYKVTMDPSTSDHTFEVRVANKAIAHELWSEWSPSSNAVRAFQPPNPVTGLSVTPTGQHNTVRFSFTPGNGNGARAEEISYRWSAGGASGEVTNGAVVTNAAFANGQNVTVAVRPVARVNGETAEGADATATVNAYGPPSAPSVSAAGGYRRVNFTWNADVNSGGRASTVTVSGSTVNASGSTGVDTDFGTQECVTVTVTNSAGQSASSQACGSSWEKYAALERRGEEKSDCKWGTPCHVYEVRLERYRPGSVVVCNITSTDGSNGHHEITVDANGNWGWQIYLPGWRVGNLLLGGDVTAGCEPRNP